MSAPNPNPFAASGASMVASPNAGQVAAPGQLPGMGQTSLDEFSVDYDQVTSNRMPTGSFVMVVSDIQVGVSGVGNPKHVLYWTCVDANFPQHLGKQSQEHLALTPAALWKHQNTFKAIGMPHDGVIKFKRADVVGRCAICDFTEQNVNGTIRINIDTVRPHPMGVGIRLEQLQAMSGQGLPQIGTPVVQATSLPPTPQAAVAPQQAPAPQAPYNHQAQQVPNAAPAPAGVPMAPANGPR